MLKYFGYENSYEEYYKNRRLVRGELEKQEIKRHNKRLPPKPDPMKGVVKPVAKIEEGNQQEYDFQALKEKHYGKSASKNSQSPSRESFEKRQLSPIIERHGLESSSRILQPKRGFSDNDRMRDSQAVTRTNLDLLNKQNRSDNRGARRSIARVGKEIMSSGLPARKLDFNDVLKYGSAMADPNFKPGAKTDAKSSITYNPYSVKDYKELQSKMNDPKFKELPKGLGPSTGNENWQKALDKKEKQKQYADRLRDMNKKYGVVVTENSPAISTAKFGSEEMSYTTNMQSKASLGTNNEVTFGIPKVRRKTELTAREKAIAAREKAKEFSKNIPKPKLAKDKRVERSKPELMSESPQKEAFDKL